MFAIEEINVRLLELGDKLGTLSRVLDDEPYRYEDRQEREKMEAEFAHLNDVLRWWSSQHSYVMDRVHGPQAGGLRVSSDAAAVPPTTKVTMWESPQTLLNRLAGRGYDLEAVLREWVRMLTERGMLSEKDAQGVQFVKPVSEFLEEEKRKDRERVKEFQEGLQKVLAKVREHAESQGLHPGVPERKALAIYNKSYCERYHDSRLLGEYIRTLSHERLLPRSFAAMRSAADALRGLLGG